MIRKFSEYDLVKALYLLSEKPLGRNHLIKALNLTEASTRTLMSKLKKQGFARNSTKGLVLTQKGRKTLEKILEKVSLAVKIKNFEAGKHATAFQIHGAAKKIKLGVEQRDFAVKAGANGAIVLIYDKKKLKMPGVSYMQRRNKKLFEEIEEKFALKKNDVVVIAFALSAKVAEEAGWRAAGTLAALSQEI